jgi:uncharacterized protein YecA (UPF0149 family)
MFTSFVQRVAPVILSLAIAPMESARLVIEGPPRPIQGRPITLVRRFAKVGRNELCPCGSGKKYKQCHA